MSGFFRYCVSFLEQFLQRPKDISFVLRELEKLNKTAGPLQGKLAADRVIAVLK
jgi:predicted dienelactone hydrolase